MGEKMELLLIFGVMPAIANIAFYVMDFMGMSPSGAILFHVGLNLNVLFGVLLFFLLCLPSDEEMGGA